MCGAGGNVTRGALMTLLLAPLVVVLDRLSAVGELTLFVLAGAALILCRSKIGFWAESSGFPDVMRLPGTS